MSWVVRLSTHYQQSPQTLTEEQITEFLRGLHERELAASTINQAVFSLRIFVARGKGNKDRYTILPTRLQQELDDYYRAERHRHGTKLRWVFLGPKKPQEPLNPSTPQYFFHRVRRKAGLPNIGGIHILRHCFASHHLMCGMNVVQLKHLMGHKSLQTTVRYMRLLEDQTGEGALISPLDRDPNSKDNDTCLPPSDSGPES